VIGVPTPTSYTYEQVDTDSTSSAGTTALNWIPNTPGLLENYYTVVSCPTSTTFEIQVSYNDGTWTTGTVTFSWNGIFFVTKIISSTSFQYQQYGPNASSNIPGTVTPHSQVAPGTHQCVTLFKTRMGFITEPSPPVTFIANGGQYLFAGNIPTGPPNVIARYLAFTGANGNNFFYIPVPPVVNGITVSTSTALLDNTTTSLLMDFSDNTLFDSIAIDIRGNNLFEMATLGRTLGVADYASRAGWFGMHNSIQNLINLGFEGGASSINSPLGWSVGSTGGALTTAPSGTGLMWVVTGNGVSGNIAGMITQPAAQDAYGIPIISSHTDYTVELWLSLYNPGVDGDIIIEFYSSSTGYTFCQTRIPVANITPQGGWFTVGMGTSLNIPIPSDTLLRVYGYNLDSGCSVAIDEIEFFYTNNPKTTTFLFSYFNRPEGLDLVTGVLGPTDDTTAIQTFFGYRDSFLFLTSIKLHETNDLADYEPSEWKVREISNNCGACSPHACSTGENFSVWMTTPTAYPPVGRGLYIYTGGQVYKLSQEIQPDFDKVTPGSEQTTWVQNDSVMRRIYVGIPVFGASAPNRVYVLDYREMDSALQLADKSPIHISFSGKMICSDLSRKWTRWNVQANCGGILYIPNIGLEFCVGGGTGMYPGSGGLLNGYNNSYWFDPTKLTDDDYGQMAPYYVTYFFVNHEMEMQIQVGAHRKLFKRYAAFITGTGQFKLTPYAASLSNPWPSPPMWPLQRTMTYDLGDGLNVSTERCAFKIASLPLTGHTDNGFNLAKFIPTLCQEPVSPIRFGAV
jgi:hypothetical protein